MAGPLADVGTLTRAIDLNNSRLLNWGRGIILEFLVPDQDQTSGLRVVLTMTKDFDRVTIEETLSDDGKTVVYVVADKKNILPAIFELKDLHVRADGLTLKVAKVPPIGPNEARVYTLTCNERTLRTTYFRN